MSTKKLYLLDAMALIYRAYFAFTNSPRLTSTGLNTGAILGFTNTLVEIIQKEKPSHIAVAFDISAPTWRHAIYTDYKAHREKQPEDISIAIPYIQKILDAFSIPTVSLAGYEADDLIGTLAYQAVQDGFSVYMVTHDKDYAQLVGDHIYIYKPAFMGASATILSEKDILEKWGISSTSQVKDILALQGDASDNIPGIPKVGIKTAQKFLQQFDSLEELLARTDELPERWQAHVRTYAEQATLSKELATIHTDVPLNFDLTTSCYTGPDPAALQAIFQELEFNSLARRVLGGAKNNTAHTPSLPELPFTQPVSEVEPAEPEITSVSPAPYATLYTTPHQYHLMDTPALRVQLLHYLELQQAFCIDTETTSLNIQEAQLVGIAFSYYSGEGYYVPIPADREEAEAIVAEFKEVLENPAIVKIGQNIKYDQGILRQYGIERLGPIFDTMLAHALVAHDSPHNLTALAMHYLHYNPIPIEELIGYTKGTQRSMRDVAPALIKDYAVEDADITWQLQKPLAKAIEQENLQQLCYNVEFPLVQVLVDMEYQGVKVDTDLLHTLSSELAVELSSLEADIHTLAGRPFNLSSPKQLGSVLFEELKITAASKKTKTGQYATGEEVLADLVSLNPIIPKILSQRELQKLKSTYVDALPQLISPLDGKIHTSYNQEIVTTGRLSSARPNLQNIPIRTERGQAIRKAFVPSQPGNVLLSVDYSQIELRIMAAFSQDETMMQAFQEGKDIHTSTASKLFKVPLEQVDAHMRRQAKMANFGMIYGISAFGLAKRMGISRSQAQEIIDAYFQEFDAVSRYMQQIIQKAKAQGYVTTLLGRKKYLRNINSRNATLQKEDERNAINAPIQGTAAEMIKIAMVNIHQWLQRECLETKLILQVHDELVFDGPEAEVMHVKAKVIKLMEDALPLQGVPIEVQAGIGKNWLEAH